MTTTTTTTAASRPARLTGKQVLAILQSLGFYPDEVARKGTEYIARREFFYRHTSADAFAATLAARGVTVTGSGEKWAPFNGGDSVAKGSHYWATFTVPAEWTA